MPGYETKYQIEILLGGTKIRETEFMVLGKHVIKKIIPLKHKGDGFKGTAFERDDSGNF